MRAIVEAVASLWRALVEGIRPAPRLVPVKAPVDDRRRR